MAGYKHLEIPGNFERYVKDKKQSANAYFRYFLTRLQKMFEYKNLPDTIPHEILDRYLFINGIALITEVNGKLYTFYGNLGGPQDVYYRPTEFIVSNPHIKTASGELFTANVPVFNLGDPTGSTPLGSSESSADASNEVKGVLLRNDTEWIGLVPMLSRYAYLMAENILTLRTADVMLRITSLLTAPSDKERAGALEYLRSIEDGRLGVIGESPFFDGVKLQSPPSNNGSYLTQFIEYQQYLKGSLYNEIGLSANYNMKREAIGKGESTLDEDALLPLADNMLMCRRQDLQKVNDMYGTSIEVSFSSSWLENAIEALKLLSSSNEAPMGAVQGVNPAEVNENGSTDESGDEVASGSFGGEVDDETEILGENGATWADATSGDDERDGEVEATGAIGADGAEGDSDSKINDLSQDPCLGKIYDKVADEVDNSDTGLTPEQLKGGNDDSNEEETSNDEENNSVD